MRKAAFGAADFARSPHASVTAAPPRPTADPLYAAYAPDPKPKRARKPRAAGSSGKTLEALVERSSDHRVTLTRIPNGVKWLGGGKTMPQKSPPDFAGTVAGGFSIWLDCKEDRDATAFDCKADHVKAHQVATLVAHGRAGATAGLLIRQVKAERLRWLDWTRLVDRKPTYPWDSLPDVGDAKAYRVDWDLVLAASLNPAGPAGVKP